MQYYERSANLAPLSASVDAENDRAEACFQRIGETVRLPVLYAYLDLAVLGAVQDVASLLKSSTGELQTGLENRGIICLPGLVMDSPSAQVPKSRGLNNAL